MLSTQDHWDLKKPNVLAKMLLCFMVASFMVQQYDTSKSIVFPNISTTANMIDLLQQFNKQKVIIKWHFRHNIVNTDVFDLFHQ